MNEEKQSIDETQLKADASPSNEFEELQTAPPKEKIKLSWVGKIAGAIIAIWIIIAFIGPFIAPLPLSVHLLRLFTRLT